MTISFAQSRQDIANFSQYQQYFNPSLTGSNGTVVKNFYRDQWTSFEDSPRTLFLSGEYNLNDEKTEGTNHAFGAAILYDTYGALTTNYVNLSYGAGIKISEKLMFRAGVAATYNNTKFDQSKLILGDPNDPAYSSIMNAQGLNKYGLNLGVAVTSDDFYVGYSLADLVKGGDSENIYFKDNYVLQHTFNAGYRMPFSGNIGLIANGIYRYDNNLKGTAEVQLKSVFLNTFWVGAGYRNDVAYTVNAGLRLKQFVLGYNREISSGKVGNSYRGGNEINLAYYISPKFGNSKKLNFW
ncbi:hypothetical protein A5893_05130 [Pedobacter psychrophilus]|uniref:Type IX secretion system membrane protein PorP/SprF n=2 Tax=Pedobacter psychrophilus TaxID=1826909 RepID=A0A179DGY7_9SPHI|nr:hypothetical protein A5893_05130 [Pedobacter psychrophilus]